MIAHFELICAKFDCCLKKKTDICKVFCGKAQKTLRRLAALAEKAASKLAFRSFAQSLQKAAIELFLFLWQGTKNFAKIGCTR